MVTQINIDTITKSTSTNSDGDKLFMFLSQNAVDNHVVIQITGDRILSSSFLNSSFGRFINVFGIDYFKQNIKISTTKGIYVQLKKYVDFYNDLVF